MANINKSQLATNSAALFPDNTTQEISPADVRDFNTDAIDSFLTSKDASYLQAVIQEAKSSNLASGTTTDLGTATGNLVHISGTTTISSFGTAQAGARFVVVFDGILTLTNSASLIIPGSADKTTAAGDCALVVSEGSGNWRIAGYFPISGSGGGGSGTVTSVSVVSANGLAGTVANPSTTPAITLSTSVSGILKGNGTAISSASAGTDYVAPGSITSDGITMNTGVILGRTTAGAGAIEEIAVGTGLTLSSGTLSAAGGSTSTVQHQVKLGESINKGQAVYVSSANGTNMIVSKASNATEATSSKTMGLIDASGVTNDFVNVITEGLLAGLDTSGASAAGDPVWLGTSGNLLYGVSNKPVAPAHMVFIGIVTRKSATVGEIFIKVQNGFELDELHNVQATSPANKDTLYYDSSVSQWKTAQVDTFAAVATASQAGIVSTGTQTFGGSKTFAKPATAPAFKQSTKTTVAGTAVTGTTSNTLCASVLIPAGTYTTGDIIQALVRTIKVGAFAQSSQRFYLNTSNSLSGATLVATATIGAGYSYIQTRRTLHIINGTNNTDVMLNTNSTFLEDIYVSTTGFSALSTVDWSVDQYFIVAFQNSSASDSLNTKFISISSL